MTEPEPSAEGINAGCVGARFGRLPRQLFFASCLGCLTIQADAPALAWRVSVDGFVGTSAAIGPDGSIFVGSTDGRLCRLSPQSGAITVRTRRVDAIQTGPAVFPDGSVVAADGAGHVFRVDSSGKILWDFLSTEEIRTTPAVGTDGVAFGAYSGDVVVLDAATGKSQWIYPTHQLMNSSPAFRAGGTVFFGTFDGRINSRHAFTGEELFGFKTGGPVLSSPAIGADGTVFVGSDDGRLYALDGEGGMAKWAIALGAPIRTSPAIDHRGRVYLGTEDGRFRCIDTADGAIRWTFTTGGPIRSSAAVLSDGTAVFGSDRVWALDVETGAVRWSWVAGHPVDVSPTVSKEGLLVFGADHGEVFALAGTAPLDNGPWPKFHANAANDGVSRGLYRPSVMTLAGSPRPGGQAGLTLRVSPNRQATTAWIEYGLSTRYGLRTPEISLPAVSGTQDKAVTLEGLLPGRLYHFRVVAGNAQGISYGGDRTVRTLVDAGASLLSLVTVAQDPEALSLVASAGLEWILESTDSLNHASWTERLRGTGAGREEILNLPPPTSNAGTRWYRVRVP